MKNPSLLHVRKRCVRGQWTQKETIVMPCGAKENVLTSCFKAGGMLKRTQHGNKEKFGGERRANENGPQGQGGALPRA